MSESRGRGGSALTPTAIHLLSHPPYVPSKANIADLPSRGEYAVPRALGAAVGVMRVPTREQLDGPVEWWFDEAERRTPPGTVWAV